MQVTQIPDGIMNTEVPKPTYEEMQNEYNYFLAVNDKIKMSASPFVHSYIDIYM